MSDKKTPLEEAKLSFEQIQKFAEEQAAEQLKEHVAEKLKHIFESSLNEDITININGEDVEVTKDGESIANVSDVSNMDLSSDMETNIGSDEEIDNDEFLVSDEEEEIGLEETVEETIQNQNMEEMNKMTMEQDAAPQPAADAVPAAPVDGTPAPADAVPAAPVEEAPAMPDLLSKLDTLINIMLQQNSSADAAVPNSEAGAQAGTEQEFDVVDDEANAAAPAAPAPAPVQEEEIEITDFESDEDKNFIDEMEEQMIEIVDEDEMPIGDTVEETRSLGFASKRTGDKALKMGAMKDEKGHHAPVTAIKENKAHKESNIDELIKENNSLKNMVKALQGKEKEFEDAFVDLRTQFNEMQLFNGKLALVNKVLMNGGLTTDEKIKICEQFDSVQTHEEASKLFKKIIKENNIKVIDGKEKLKGASTNTAKPKSTSEPLYESEEARRAKKLAGITKIEDEE